MWGYLRLVLRKVRLRRSIVMQKSRRGRGGFVSFGCTCSAVSATTSLRSGFGEFEVEGGLGEQDDLLKST